MSKPLILDSVTSLLKNWAKNVGVFHCTVCHHEWTGLKHKPPTKCSWCGANGKLID